MRLLHRYLLKEILVTFAVWVMFLFLLLFVMFFLRGTEVLLGSAVTALDLAKVGLCMAPHFLVRAVPVGLLLAILLGFGRLTEDRELVGMNALGISPMQVLTVPFAAGWVLGAVVFALSFTLEPWGLTKMRSVISEMIKRNVVGEVKPGVFFEDLSELTLYAEQVDEVNQVWTNVLLHDERDEQAPLLMLSRQGHVNPLTKGDALRLGLTDGSVHMVRREADSYTWSTFERGELAIPVGEAIWRKSRFRASKEEMTPGELLQAAREARERGENPRGLLMSFHWRLGQAFSPLAFAMIGVPLAISGGRTRGYLFAILAYVGYYLLSRLLENMGTTGLVPLWVGGQLTNAVFAAGGLWMLSRIARLGIQKS